jgi:hypothetical protein
VDTRTQNAPSRIAPTNANTAKTASTLSLKARSTLRPPWTDRGASVAEIKLSSNDNQYCTAKSARTAALDRRVAHQQLETARQKDSQDGC